MSDLGWLRWGVLVTAPLLIFRTPSAQAAEAQASPIYLALRTGMTTDEFAPTGWWLDVGVLKEWTLTPLWYVTVEAALAATRDTSTRTLPYYSSDDATSHNRRLLVGIPLRAGIGLGPDVFGFELGAVAGAGYSNLTSDICENESGLKPMLGGYAGPVLRLGSERSVRIAAQIQMVTPIYPRCTNVGTPPSGVGYYPIWFSDSPPNPSFVAQLGLAL